MKHVPTDTYRRAFVAYLRTGAPIPLALKQAGPTTHYVWRTRGDERVRLAHAENDGGLFAWDDPPATGHPGEDFGCRCMAEPYVPGETEFTYHEIVGELVDEPDRWEWEDFLRHLYAGGEPVSLSEIGHWKDVVEFYGYRHTNDDGVGAFRRLSDQIVAKAREVKAGSFTVSFEQPYDFTEVAYPHGDAVVYGQFSGHVSSPHGYLVITGRVQYYFWDIFTDPADLRELFLGTSDPAAVETLTRRITDFGGWSYVVSDYWETRFQAEAIIDERLSIYK